MQLRVAVDVKDGVYVYATGGDRSRYEPPGWLGQRLPPDQAMTAIARQFGVDRFYVADLDGIRQGAPEVMERYQHIAHDVWLDLGVQDRHAWQTVVRTIGLPLILATETISWPEWPLVLAALRYDDVVSLDCREDQVQFRDGMRSLTQCEGWIRTLPHSIRLLHLDLARVGSRRGVDWSAVRWLRALHTRLWVGGGIRGGEDLQQAEDLHVEGAVVATALFDGRIQVHEMSSPAVASDPAVRGPGHEGRRI